MRFGVFTSMGMQTWAGVLDLWRHLESSGWDIDQAGQWIAAHTPRETRGYVRRVRSRALRYALAIDAAAAALVPAAPVMNMTAALAP